MLEQISDLLQYPTTLNFNQFCLSQREVLTPEENPFSGLSFGI